MAQDAKAEQLKALEKRLKDAFPDRWPNLSHEEKTRALNKFHRLVWDERISAKELVAYIGTKAQGYGLFILGAVIAILAGLTVNVTDRFFLGHFGEWYGVVPPVALVILILWLNRFFESSLNEDYRVAGFLDKLLNDDPSL